MRVRESVGVVAGRTSVASATPAYRTTRARRTVIALAVLAAMIYFGFILMMAWR